MSAILMFDDSRWPLLMLRVTGPMTDKQSEWIRQQEPLLRERVLGNANIITSAPIRLALSLIFHLKPLPMPYAAVAGMDSALRFVIGKLEEGGFGAEAERIRRDFGLPGIRAG